jgi:hypothetical protein
LYVASLDTNKLYNVTVLTVSGSSSELQPAAWLVYEPCTASQYDVVDAAASQSTCQSCPPGGTWLLHRDASAPSSAPPCRQMRVTMAWLPGVGDALNTTRFHIAARWADGSAMRVGDAASVDVTVRVGGATGVLGQPHTPCRFADNATACVSTCASIVSCVYEVSLPDANRAYELQVLAGAGVVDVVANLT